MCSGTPTAPTLTIGSETGITLTRRHHHRQYPLLDVHHQQEQGRLRHFRLRRCLRGASGNYLAGIKDDAGNAGYRFAGAR